MLLTRSLRRFQSKVVVKCFFISLIMFIILKSNEKSIENGEEKGEPTDLKPLSENGDGKSALTDLKTLLRYRLKHLKSSCSSILSGGQSLMSITKLQSKTTSKDRDKFRP